MAKKADLKALASKPLAGFKHKEIQFGDEKAMIREPSAGAWLAWQDKIKELDHENGEMPLAEKAQIQLEADVLLFMSVFCDEDGHPVFDAADEEQVRGFYGPVHSRILKEALDMLTPVAQVEAK